MIRAWLSVLIIFGAAIAAGCASTPAQTNTTKEAVAEPPCRIDVPEAPVFPADTLTGREDLFTLGKTLWADRLARRAHQLKLETALRGCTK